MVPISSSASPAGRHRCVIGAHQRERLAVAANLALGTPLTAPISAHRRLRGPYTAAGSIVRKVVPDALERRPELVTSHVVEILSVAPELRDLVPASLETLTSLAVPEERTRFYAAARTLRIAHGLAEFLRDYVACCQGETFSLVVDDLHQADQTDQEFLAVLLRRMDPGLLTLVLGTTTEFFGLPDLPGPPAAGAPAVAGGLPPALRRYCEQIAAPVQVSVGCAADSLESAEKARCYVNSDCTDDDPVSLASYLGLPLVDRQRLHDTRADELEAAGEESLTWGAIPYHRERGTDPFGRGAAALALAMDSCMLLGFYEATVDFCYRGRALSELHEAPADLWWTFTSKLPTSLSALGRGDEAEEICDETRARTINPLIHIQFGYATAMLYTRHLQPQRRDHERAMAWINQAIVISSLLPDPKKRAFNTVFHNNGLALIEAHRGHPERALELVTEGIAELDRELGQHEHQLHRSVLRYNRGQVLASLGRLTEALVEYQWLVTIDPHYPEYHFDLANLLRRLGRDEDALAEYETTMRLGPPFPEPYYNRADTLAARGEFEAALADFEYVLELDPEYLDAHLNRAGILTDLGRIDAANEALAAGLALAPENPHLLCLKARLAMECGNLETAGEALAAAVAAAPDLPQAWALYGSLSFEIGDLPAAVAHLSRAVDLDPDVAVLFNRGSVYQAQGEWANALADFDRVVQLAPDEADGWLCRAQCRAQLGDHRAAHDDVQAFLQLEPSRIAEVSELIAEGLAMDSELIG